MFSKNVIYLCLIFMLLVLPSAFAQDNDGPRVHTRPFLLYGNNCWADERGHLDNLAIALQSDPTVIGYITVYDGSPSCRREAIARAIRARNYLVNYRKIEWNRVAWRYGGQREELTMEAHLIPRGMSPFKLDPTVDQGENKEDCRAEMYRRMKCPKW
jgi:hypothetical protein